ncbi:MAG: hypothetical protein HYT76_07500 [Deltaproteobacteria bacterium]|nr:hypothetical protein [Deltaproteobacteria bacterium]
MIRIFLSILFIFLSQVSFADWRGNTIALTCPNPPAGLEEGTALCDCEFDTDAACDPEENYIGGKICIVQPVADQNINDSTVCILGKIRSYEDLQNLIDLVAAISSPDESNPIPDELAEPDPIEIENNGGSFRILLPLQREGEFQAIVHADFFTGGSNPIQKIAEVRDVTRISVPDLNVTAARENGTVGQANYITSPLTDTDGDGIPDSEDPDWDNDGIYNDADPDDDNDGICDRMENVVDSEGNRICVAGDRPDEVARRRVQVTLPPELQEIDDTFSANNIDLCLRTEEGSSPGSELTFTVYNEIVDSTAGYEKTLQNNSEVTATQDGLFCPEGHVITVPLGHGENRIAVEVSNAATVGSVGHRIALAPIQNDIRGPELCVSYFRDDDLEEPLEEVDGQVLAVRQRTSIRYSRIFGVNIPVGVDLVDEIPSFVMVAVSVCGEEPDQLPERPRRRNRWGMEILCNEEHSICFWPNNQTIEDGTPLRTPMAERTRGGTTYHASPFYDLRFPVNTFTISARDVHGNKTVQSHSFGFGKVRSMADASGAFQPRSAQVPKALSMYLPASYVTGELKQTLLKILNSDKFKQETFPSLFEPHRPATSVESSCPEAFPEGKLRVINLFEHTIGDIEIPRLQLLSGNRLRVTLQINDLEGKADLFEIELTDTDDDGIPDVDDTDDDCAEGNPECQGLSPDTDNPTGDNDGDGHPNQSDFPGELARIPVYETWMLPALLTVERLTVRIQMEFYRENDKLRVRILNPPGEMLISVNGMGEPGRLVQLECNREAHTYFDGEPATIDSACAELASLNERVSGSGRDENCLNQNLDDQLESTLEEMLRRQIPFALNQAIDESAETRLSQVALDMFDKKLALDLYADLSKSDIRVSPIGLFLKLDALLAPAGLTEADATDEEIEELNAFEFFRNNLGPQFENNNLTALNFGPIREVESPEPVDPAEEASHVGSELNLALGEEFVNSLLHSANTLLHQLSLEKPDFMDMSVTQLREMGMAAPDIGGSVCLDKEGHDVLDDGRGPGETDDPTNNWKCFPFNLDLGTMLGDGMIAGLPGETPLVVRTKLNPNAPLMARIVNFSTMATPPDESGSTRPPMITAELEIGMRDGEMQVFEGQFIDTGRRREGYKRTERKIEVKDWCERQPLAHPRCADPNHEDLPMVSYKTNGRISISLTFLIDEGLVTITGGITGHSVSTSTELTEESTSYAVPTDWEVDTDRTYLNLSVKENYTLARDTNDSTTSSQGIVTTFQNQIIALLTRYLAETDHSIWVDVPLKAPLSQFCALHPEVREICDCVGDHKGQTCQATSAVDDLLEETEPYGIFGIEINDLLIGMTGSAYVGDTREESVESINAAPRYLLMGAGVCMRDCLRGADGECVEPMEYGECIGD